MVNERQEHETPLGPVESYNAAVQLHNQEFRTLGERTTAFVIAQSILVAAFVTILVNPNWFPYAFPLITLGISIVGILFCALHHLAGKAGSYAAFNWRRQMQLIEKKQKITPWKKFYDLSRHTCKNKNGKRTFFKQLFCARCLLQRLPLPSAWLFYPTLFLIVWVSGIIYVVWVLCLSSYFIAALVITVLLLATAGLIIHWRFIVWWNEKRKN